MRFLSLASVTTLAVLPSVYAAVVRSDVASTILAELGADLTSKNHYGAPIPPWKPGNKPGWYYGPNQGAYPGVPCLGGNVCNYLQQFPGVLHCPPKYPPYHPQPKTTKAKTTKVKTTKAKTTYHPQTTKVKTTVYHTTPKVTTTYYHHTTQPETTIYHTTQPETTVYHTTPKVTTTYHQTTTPEDTTTVYHQTTTTEHTTTKATTTSSSTSITPTPTPGGYTPTFYNITAAVQADDYMTFGLVETVTDCEEMCDSVEGCGFVNTYHDVNGKDGSPLLTCALFSKCHGAEDADNRGGQSQPDGSIDFIADSSGWCKVV